MIIVTGGAGFIGSNVVKGLNEAGEDRILVVDRLGTGDKWKNLVDLKFLDYEHKDAFLQKLDRGVFDWDTTALVHLGACSSTTERDADYLMANNYEYSKMLVSRLARNVDIRIIYASSAATYGDGTQGYSDTHEAVPSFRPLNMYGYSKQLFDLWAIENGMTERTVGLKYFNVFGPNEYHKADMRSVAIRAYFQAKQTGKIRLFKSYLPQYGHGEQKRDFIYVKDAVKITLFFLEQPDLNGTFNVGTGNPRTFNDLAAAVFRALKREPDIEYIDMPEGLAKRYQYYTSADLEKLRDAGFQEDFWSLEDAVLDYVTQWLEKDPRGESEQ